MEVAHELRHKLLDNILLLPEGFLGETKAQRFPLSGMGVVISHADGRDSWNRIDSSNVYWVLGKILAANPVPVDVCEGFGRIEC